MLYVTESTSIFVNKLCPCKLEHLPDVLTSERSSPNCYFTAMGGEQAVMLLLLYTHRCLVSLQRKRKQNTPKPTNQNFTNQHTQIEGKSNFSPRDCWEGIFSLNPKEVTQQTSPLNDR